MGSLDGRKALPQQGSCSYFLGGVKLVKLVNSRYIQLGGHAKMMRSVFCMATMQMEKSDPKLVSLKWWVVSWRRIPWYNSNPLKIDQKKTNSSPLNSILGF